MKTRGRPTLAAGEGKTARVDLRVLPADKAAWQAKATAAGLTLQAWIERALGRAR
jgi:predicted DNA binding CopG/RHH family protein